MLLKSMVLNNNILKSISRKYVVKNGWTIIFT